MRNMSFSMTTEQIRSGTKTVTRRLGWKFLKPGDVVIACEKCQGLKKGEKVKKIRPICIAGVRKERLADGIFHGGTDEVAKEGFPGMGTMTFILLFCKANKCNPDAEITRIEFEYLEES